MQPPLPHSASRRDFLKQSATVGSGLMIGSALASRAFAAGDETIKVGLIGCGGRGTGATVQALSTEGNVKLVAMADAFADQLDDSLNNITAQFRSRPERVSVDDEHKFVGFDAYKNVLDSDADLVILATPPGFRPIHFEAAVNAGKHIFMEKPVAVDMPGVRQVLAAVEIARTKNLAVGVGLQRHHQYEYLETMKRLQDGAIGDIVDMRVYWNSGGVWDPRRSREQCKTEMEYQMRNWYYYVWLCGDHIVEQHIHNLDVGNWLKGAYPIKAAGMGGRQVRTDPKFGEIYDHFAVEYEYADGSKMFSQCRHIQNCWSSVSEHASGSRGHSNISGGQISSDKVWKYDGKRNDPYQTEHDDLFAAIRNGTPYNEGENGAMSTYTAILGRLAVYGGKEVTLEQAMNSDISLMPSEFSWEGTPVSLPNENGEYPIPVPGITEVV
ncbi:MAG: Gfo/Idh/MocA family oxidoreductase [Planctomycetota bacterium]|nr:Gfo/Idh/MocA family oxidoreductase [Planctomycetota bacterium]